MVAPRTPEERITQLEADRARLGAELATETAAREAAERRVDALERAMRGVQVRLTDEEREGLDWLLKERRKANRR